ncbi:MAG: acyl-CoA dehydrogenase family protein [Thermodesulfobacteriota bacterium]|jgi:alkylation response protein AidB-like acyl-CoA dehydrogenase
MDFEFTEEQKLLQKEVRKYLAQEIEPIADEYDRKGPMSKENALKFLKDLKPFGYVGTLVPEQYGGPGLDHIYWGILHEELRRAYAGLGGIVGITSASTMGIVASINEELRQRILPGLVAGEKIICTAITEPNYGSDPSGVDTQAVLDGENYRINGTKMWISNGTISDYVIVVAQTDPSKGAAGICQILVERGESPFLAEEIHKLGVRSFPTAELVFEDCRVPKKNLLYPVGEGYKRTITALNHARANAAIASVGIAQAAVNASIRYAKERVQFKKVIGSFQLIQEMIADMLIEVEAARLLTYRAFYLIDKGVKCRKEVSMAKAFATEMGVRVTSKAIEIHGAYGLAEELAVERYFRDARCYTIPDGTTEIQKLIIGREVLGMQAFV